MSVEAMKQALDALENSKPSDAGGMLDSAEMMANLWHAHYAAIRSLRTAIQQAAETEPVDFPAGAIVNGRTLMQRIEAYPFESQGGDIRMCSDWHDLRRCFEHLADYASTRPAAAK